MYRLVPLANQVHLHPAFRVIVESVVFKVVGLKIRAEFTIDSLQQIQVKRSGYALGSL